MLALEELKIKKLKEFTLRNNKQIASKAIPRWLFTDVQKFSLNSSDGIIVPLGMRFRKTPLLESTPMLRGTISFRVILMS